MGVGLSMRFRLLVGGWRRFGVLFGFFNTLYAIFFGIILFILFGGFQQKARLMAL